MEREEKNRLVKGVNGSKGSKKSNIYRSQTKKNDPRDENNSLKLIQWLKKNSTPHQITRQSSGQSIEVQWPKTTLGKTIVLNIALERRSSESQAVVQWFETACSISFFYTALDLALERRSSAPPAAPNNLEFPFLPFLHLFCLRFFVTMPNSMKSKPNFMFSRDERNSDVKSLKIYGTHNEKPNKQVEHLYKLTKGNPK